MFRKQHRINVRSKERNQKRLFFFLFICINLFLLSSCSEKIYTTKPELDSIQLENSKEPKASGEKEMDNKKININGQTVTLQLNENKTTEEFLKQLPFSATMKDLNGNEKFVYLDKSLPVTPQEVTIIEKGDVMLFGTDCLVIFYQSFQTTYTYTRIGKIKETDKLDILLEPKEIQLVIDF